MEWPFHWQAPSYSILKKQSPVTDSPLLTLPEDQFLIGVTLYGDLWSSGRKTLSGSCTCQRSLCWQPVTFTIYLWFSFMFADAANWILGPYTLRGELHNRRLSLTSLPVYGSLVAVKYSASLRKVFFYIPVPVSVLYSNSNNLQAWKLSWGYRYRYRYLPISLKVELY